MAYVRCQRCGHPVCPACQVPSAVGVHCVDCTARASAGRRAPTTALGGRLSDGSTLITKALIAVCVVVFIAQKLPASTAMGLNVIRELALVPVFVSAEPWRLLTSALLHGSIMHLAFNMWALWVLGGSLEPLLGRWRYSALMALSALGGSTAVYWLSAPGSRDWFTGTVGASGAVFGLFAAMFVIQRRFGRDTTGIVGILVLNLVFSFTAAGISWQGHLGGLITGGVVAAVYAWAPRERRGALSAAGTAAVALALVGLVALRLASL
ncbi:rhomboid family intramembrane serine protease [Actinomyces marmotae]|uniref:rhomboid family intramembrane serine protease n=1 Tax=Actinomyces marmotae TaxID=2737173 RepID=UPI001F1A106A|nr:rhomboid family intramembrane serine protease [Actinomyces marmotae]